LARTEEQRAGGGQRGVRPSAAEVNGRHNGGASAGPRRPYALRRIILPALIIVILLAVALGALYFFDQASYVSTDNAAITGTLVQLGPPNAGQLRSVAVDVGDSVEKNQVVATVTSAGGQSASLRSPLDGVVLARFANPGDTVTAGRPVVSLVDPSDLWVQAQLDESLVGRVRPGQVVDVTIDAVGSTLEGRVVTVGRASTASVSPSANPNSNSRSKPVVPVKIAIEQLNPALVYGGQAFVRIHVS
jgi:multidrug resistance efflux pump